MESFPGTALLPVRRPVQTPRIGRLSFRSVDPGNKRLFARLSFCILNRRSVLGVTGTRAAVPIAVYRTFPLYFAFKRKLDRRFSEEG